MTRCGVWDYILWYIRKEGGKVELPEKYNIFLILNIFIINNEYL